MTDIRIAEATGRPDTLARAFLRATRTHPGDTALTTFDRDASPSTPEASWAELGDRVSELAAGLRTSGVGAGTVIATMLRNRSEFFAVDLAAVCIRATAVAIYNTLPPAEVAYVLADSDARIVVTESRFRDVVVHAVSGLARPPEIIVLDDPAFPGLAELAARGDPAFDLAASVASVAPSDVAALIYTSGTTGVPKGVEITHDNLVAAWEAVVDMEPKLATASRVLSYLPAAHIGDRLYGYYAAVFSGAAITSVADFSDTIPALRAVAPSLFVGVPRIWEKLSHDLELSEKAGVGADELRSAAGFRDGSLWLSGSAPIDPGVLEYLAGIEIPVYEGYGMTEATCVISGNARRGSRPGTVGRAAKGVEVRLDVDGEVLVRGRVVTRGYRNRPEETQAAIDPDGWLRTGDIGALDEGGFLSIIGRKKEMIINATGKNIAPAAIEERLRSATSVISNVAVVGDRRPYLVALIEVSTPDPVVDTALAISVAIDEVNTHLSRAEQIKHFAIVEDRWDAASGLVTPTGKLRRATVSERYAGVIDRLYADAERSAT
jgi:long-chain acyl-CoA synthetase